MKFQLLLVLCICMLVMLPHGYAQMNVSGVVTNESNEPLVGANVLVKGSTVGAITDETGSFQFSNIAEADTLLISYIGYATKQVPVNGQSTLNIQLSEDESTLDEVIVVGYGSQKKSDVTGSVRKVSGEELLERPVSNVSQALQGRVAGVEVFNTSPAPGNNARIRIRGINSLNTNKDPLVVVDGIIGVDLAVINPADIESIEVLKDASATAIYGARGANGVIMVTTKRGATGKPRVEYNGFVTFSSRRGSVETLDAEQFMQVWNEAYSNAEKYDPIGYEQGKYPEFNPADYPRLFDEAGNPIYDTNWEDEVYRNTVSSNHTLSMSGGTETNQYFVSLSYADDNGIMLNSSNDRFTGKLAFDSKLNERLKVGVSLLGVRNVQNAVHESNGALNVPRLVVEMIPILPVKYPDGTWSKNNDFYASAEGDNPVRVAQERYTERNTDQLFGDVFLEVNILKDLKFRTQFSTILKNNKNNFYSGRELRNLSADQNGRATVYTRSRLYWQSENYLTWDKNWDRLSVTGLVGFSWLKDQSEDLRVYAENFLDDFYQWRNISAAGNIPQGGIFGNTFGYQLNSYFTRWSVNFDSKYLLTVTGRYDGSSRFGENNKYAFFPSVGVAWRISEEPFFQSSLISNLKLRGSIGYTGNQEFGSYESLQFLSTSNVLFADGLETALSRSSFGNEDLQWETTEQIDIGLELELLQGRLDMEIDVYHKTTDDLLLDAPLPFTVGVGSVRRNIGSVQNQGLEVSLGARIIRRPDFTWSMRLNWAANRNEVLELVNDNADIFPGPWFLGQTNIIRVGEPIGSIWGKTRLGTWNLEEEEEAQQYGRLPGDLKLADLNEDGQINSDDNSIIGQMYPDWTGNIINEFTFRQFDFLMEWRFSVGNDVINATKHSAEDRQTLTNSLATVTEGWTPENQNTNIAQVRAWGTYYTTNMDSWWVEDGSFARLQNLALGYTLPNDLLESIGISRLRAYVSGTNLLLFTEYSNYDPEVETYGYSHAIGLDFYPYAKPKSIIVGANVSF